MTDFKKSCLKLLLHNRRNIKGYQYTIPSPDTYPYQWLWDSCFHAIMLCHFNVSDAKKELTSLISKQFENGMIPHIIYWKQLKTTFPKIIWGKDSTSTITQPPMLAYAAFQIFQKMRDKRFLSKIYPRLYHYYRYLITERDPHGKNLIGIMNPDESGEDNSPRFDIPLGLPPVHSLKENTKSRLNLVKQNIACNFDAPFCMRNFFWVKDAPFNMIMAENLRLLASVAEILGYMDDESYFMKERDNIFAAMRKLTLEDGICWSTYGREYTKIKVKTWAIFSPLFGKLLTQKEAKVLVEKHLLNPKEFWTKFPVPTVSIDEPSFNPKGFWRGPTWIAVNWFIYKGLINYGFNDIARQIKKSSIGLIEKSGFREYFNPQTGEGLGAKNFTWGGLVVDML